jgi:hypothetical protein
MKVAGPKTWKAMRAEVKKLPCSTCVDHGLLMLDGAQDVVNVNQLDRPLHDVTRFTMFKAEVDKAAEKSGLLVHSSEPSNNELMLGIGLGVAGLIAAFVFR